MKTLEDILEALLINTTVDWTNKDPSIEFKAIHDDLQRIVNDKTF